MNKKLLLNALALVLGGGIFSVSLFVIDPEEQLLAGLIGMAIGGLSAVTAFFTFVFVFGAELVFGRQMTERYFMISLRRSVFISLVALAAVVLNRYVFFTWIEFAVLTLFFVFLEFAFTLRKKD